MTGVTSSQHDTPPPASSAEPEQTSQEPDRATRSPATRRLRYTPTALVPLGIGALCAIPLAAALGWWGLLIAVPFILAVIVVRRIGLDIAADEIRVRGALSSLRIPRSDLAGFRVDEKHVHLVRTDGSTVRMPTVRPRDLPMLRDTIFPGSATRLPGHAS